MKPARQRHADYWDIPIRIRPREQESKHCTNHQRCTIITGFKALTIPTSPTDQLEYIWLWRWRKVKLTNNLAGA
jgi:hypothetical protein